jgi:hypothetical protein
MCGVTFNDSNATSLRAHDTPLASKDARRAQPTGTKHNKQPDQFFKMIAVFARFGLS